MLARCLVLTLGLVGLSSSACATASADGAISAAGEALLPSRTEGNHYVVLKMAFTNSSDRPRTVQGYVVSWPGGTKEVSARFVVEPGRSTSRTVRVTYREGDLAALNVENASVHVR